MTCTQGEGGQPQHKGPAYGTLSDTHAGWQKEDSRLSCGKYFSSHKVWQCKELPTCIMPCQLELASAVPLEAPSSTRCPGTPSLLREASSAKGTVKQYLVSHTSPQTQNFLLLYTSASLAVPVCRKCLAAPGTGEEVR